MGRFIATSLSLLALVVGFNLASGVVDGWLTSLRLSGSSASAQAPATAAAPVTPAGTGSATGSVVAAPASGSVPASASAPAAAAPATGSATSSVAAAPASGSIPAATDSIFAAADAIIGAGTDSAVVAIPLDDEYEGDVYNRVPNDYLSGIGWRVMQLTPIGKDEFSARAARSASAAIEGTLQVGGAVFDSTRKDLPALMGTVSVEQGMDPVAPKRLTGYLMSLPEVGPQFAVVFDFDCNGDAEACSQAIGVRVLEVFERQVETQKDGENWPLSGFGLRDAVFTNTGNPGYWKAAVFQGILLNGGRRSSRGAIARGEIFLTTSLVDNDPQRVEGYLRTPGRPTASFRIAECSGWGPCADELGKLLAFRLAVVLDVANTPPATGGVPRPHGTP